MFLLSGATGCIGSHTQLWETTKQDIQLDGRSVTLLRVRTHNGSVDVRAIDGRRDISVEATIRAGGIDEADAKAALDALEVYAVAAGRTADVGWNWQGPKGRNWSASVSVVIEIPQGICISVKTHNGHVKVAGVDGSAFLETHNGGIAVKNLRGHVSAKTHNGFIRVAADSENMNLKTHNGPVTVTPANDAFRQIRAHTHNGAVELNLPPDASANVHCSSPNGSVQCTPALQNVIKTKRSLNGVIGQGGGGVSLKTHNGDICIQ
jgi:hypothetical protein